MNIEQIRKQAQNEDTPSKILSELATNKDLLTRQYVANNPNSPVKVLEKLSQEFPEEIVANPIFELLLLENTQNILICLFLARSPKASAKTLNKLSKCDSFDMLEAVAENLNTPLYVLNNLIAIVKNKPFSTKVLCAIAQNPNATQNILDKLIDIGVSHPVYLAVIENPKSSLMTLEKIAYHQDKIAASLIFKHSNIPLEILHQLSLSACVNTRRLVAEYSRTPYAIIIKLAKDISENVREKIAERLDVTEEIINILSQDSSVDVRCRIASREHLSQKIINKLIQDSSELVRGYIADNQDISEKTINKLIKDSSELVRCAVARRQNLSEDIANILANDSCEEIRYRIAQSRAISENTANILANDRSEFVRRELVRHRFIGSRPSLKSPRYTSIQKPGISARTLEILLKKSDRNDYVELPHNINLRASGLKFQKDYPISAIYNLETRQDIASHPQATFKILDCLKSDRYDCVRQAVAQNVRTAKTILDVLKNDPVKIVRQAVAENPNTFIDTLQAISSHKNASTDLLEYLAGENCNIIHQNILNHQNASPKAVDIIKFIQNKHTQSDRSIVEQLAKDSRAEVRKIVAQNENVSPAILADLAEDNNMQVVLAVARNSQTTSCILEKLAAILNQEIYKAIARHHNTSPKAKCIMEFMKSIKPVKISEHILEELADSE